MVLEQLEEHLIRQGVNPRHAADAEYAIGLARRGKWQQPVLDRGGQPPWDAAEAVQQWKLEHFVNTRS